MSGRAPALRAFDGLYRLGLAVAFRLLKVWWRLTHPTIEGVYVAVRCGDELLMIRNSYRRAYSLPSGRRGRNEDPAAAAVRELHEEVGIETPAEALRLVAEVRHRERLVDDHVHFFELRLDVAPEIRIDHREVVWAGFEPLARARERAVLPIVRRYLEGTLDEISVRPAAEP